MSHSGVELCASGSMMKAIVQEIVRNGGNPALPAVEKAFQQSEEPSAGSMQRLDLGSK